MPDFSTWMFVFARAGALLVVIPFFSAQNFPVAVRLGLCVLLAWIITPGVEPVSASQLPIGSLIFLFAKEVGTGLLLGFSCRILFFALELAGAIVATEMGLMLSSTFNPLSATNVTAPGMIFFWMAGMILLSLDLHHWMLAGFQSSFKLVPIGGFQLSEGLAIEVLEKTTRMFRIAVQLTAPIMAVSFVVTLIFALLSRAVPQMNVFSENFPARTLAGLVVFGLTFSLTGQHLVNFLRRLPEDFQRMASLMGGG